MSNTDIKNGLVVNKEGTKRWYQNNELHRAGDLPAVEYFHGGKEWHIKGKRHRENGPAIEYPNGNKFWYADNVLHREDDLPAIEYNSGKKEWYVQGKRHRNNNLPAIEGIDGHKEWWFNGERHRDGGPAIEDRNQYWYQFGKLHRENGPAVEYSNGWKEWWISGDLLTEEDFNHYVEMKRLNQQLHQDLDVNDTPKTKPPKI